MKWALSVLIIFLLTVHTLALDLSLAPGLSLRNAAVYLVLLAVLLRLVVSSRFKMELPGIHACFAFLIIYATVSFLIAFFAIQYPNYSALAAIINLKGGLLDFAIVLALFFYGCRSTAEAISVCNVFLTGIGVANLVSVLDGSGLLGWQIIAVANESNDVADRVQGALGEANQHAVICAMTLPAMLVRSIETRGFAKLPWLLWFASGLATLFMTASRGAIFGLILATIWGVYIFRRFISAQVVIRWVGVLTLLLTVTIIAFSATYTDLLTERLVVQTFDSNMTDATSGRTWIWATAIKTMMASPWTFITGFGWNVYSSMNFMFAPHNTYLGFWFNLGLPGVVAFTLILVQALFVTRSAAEIADVRTRGYLAAYAVGLMTVAFGVFFVELSAPWLYVWMYTGLMLRAAVEVRNARQAERRAAAAEAPGSAPLSALGARRPAARRPLPLVSRQPR